MRNRLLALLLLTTAIAAPAHADMPVIDIANVTQSIMNGARTVQGLNNQVRQIVQLEQTVNALAHGDIGSLPNLVSQLGSAGMVSPLGTNSTQIVEALRGTQALASSLQTSYQLGQTAALVAGQVYYPVGGGLSAQRIIQVAQQLAAARQYSEASLANTQKQLDQLIALRNQLSGASTDALGATQANARLTGELTTLVAQQNFISALSLQAATQARINDAQELQIFRCNSEKLVNNANALVASAQQGQVMLVSASSGTSAQTCGLTSGGGTAIIAPPAATTSNASYTVPSTSSGGDGVMLASMTSQSWGQQAVSSATSIGVNPAALATTCVLESNCQSSTGGSGSISGAFQMSNAAYSDAVQKLQASNPQLASSMTGKSDPASMATAAAQYLYSGAQTLQSAGISNPTVLDVRSYYQWGPANAATVANAPDNALLAPMLVGLTPAQIAANNVTGSTTVGQWRQTIVNRAGDAAYTPVLMGST